MGLRSEYTPQARKCNDSSGRAYGCAEVVPFAKVRAQLLTRTAKQKSEQEWKQREASTRRARAGLNSMRNVKAKDKTAWLALFADDAVI